MVILGIDPGYERLGWGVVKKTTGIEYVACGVIQTDADLQDSERLSQAFRELQAIIKMYKPEQAAVESLFFFKNQKTVIQVAQARGVILTCLSLSDVTVHEYTPPQIKSFVAGDGQADKKAVEKMVRLQLPGVPTKLMDDTLDALAAALTFAFDKQYD